MVPTAAPVTTPVLLTLAVAGAADVQVTVLVMLAVVEFEYVPVAVRLAVSPLAIVAEGGVMAMLVNTGAVTVSVALFEFTPPSEAVMVLLPMLSPEAIPLAFSVATAVLLECQATEAEMSPVLASS